MAHQTVALYTVTSGDRLEHARRSLSQALDGAPLGDVDDAGIFELEVDAESPDRARELVSEALARAGTGDDFVLRETTEGREMPAGDPRQGDVPSAADQLADQARSVAGAMASDRRPWVRYGVPMAGLLLLLALLRRATSR